MLDPLTYTPDWRYGTAMQEIEREDAGMPLYFRSKDPAVQKLKRVLRLRTGSGRVEPEAIKAIEGCRTIMLALRLYEDSAVGGLRDTMEAALLDKDAPEDFFTASVCPRLNKWSISVYKHLFYDVDECVDKPFWVQRNLFVPNKNLRGEKFNTAYMWKVVAYHGGVKFLTQFAIDGSYMEDHLKSWITRMGVTEHVKTILKSTHSYAKLMDGAGTPVASVAQNLLQEESANSGDDSSDNAVISESIRLAIDVPHKDLIQEAEAINGRKYENKEPEENEVRQAG